MNKVLACVDGSAYAKSVCDHAIWAARQLEAPLDLLHVLDRHPETAVIHDMSGSIGLGAQASLLQELATIDEQRGKVAQSRGRELLEGAAQLARGQGLDNVETRLRHGALVESLTELESDVRLFVLGKRGEHANFATLHLGSQLERAVRAVHRPLLVASRQFKSIERFLIAFDRSATTRKGVEMIAASPLLRGLSCHVVTAGNDTTDIRDNTRWAQERLSEAGFMVEAAVQAGPADVVISDYVAKNRIDLLVMGAYGHTRIRQFIVGSTTTSMIRTCPIPILLLR
jgi:nucleotide-binding universal stress UspA family protein